MNKNVTDVYLLLTVGVIVVRGQGDLEKWLAQCSNGRQHNQKNRKDEIWYCISNGSQMQTEIYCSLAWPGPFYAGCLLIRAGAYNL